jgi:NAD(P)-dependent dehydrogenase (short-subunit alcohol dehydrogenase family)
VTARFPRVVVTGAGGGIGAALARRFAADGAQVVVNDLDAAAAQAVADEIGGLAVPGDAANEADVRRLVDTAWAELGGCDLFCANAGILTAGSADAPDADWEKAWQVNVMSHVYVARALLPRWLDNENGQGGRLLFTVSAAGLLTLLGSAPYSVTKHAALGFAEWLRATYAHRGITVQALCPQGVNTAMMIDGGRSASKTLLAAGALEPEDVAETVVEGLAGNSFLILPHPEVAEYYQRRATDTDRWLGGMNKIQRGFDAAGMP